MSRAAREQFLSDVHVGVLSVAGTSEPNGTLAVPIWYAYSPEEGVRVITSRTSAKGKALDAAGRYAIVAQREDLPYKYVSVEGALTEVRRVDLQRDLVPMAVRYLGDDVGAAYARQWAAADAGADHVYTMRPERWASSDMTGLF